MKPKKSSSPLPEFIPATEMSFPEAIAALLDGKRITRLAWEQPQTYIGLDNQLLRIKFHDKPSFVDLILHEGDLNATDWVVVEEAI